MRKFFASVTLNAKIFASPFRISNSNFALEIPNSHQPNVNAKNFTSATSHAKPMRNANGHLCKLLTAKREAKSHSKSLFKDLHLTISHNHPLLRKTHYHLVKQIPHHSAPRGHQEEEEQSTSRPY